MQNANCLVYFPSEWRTVYRLGVHPAHVQCHSALHPCRGHSPRPSPSPCLAAGEAVPAVHHARGRGHVYPGRLSSGRRACPDPVCRRLVAHSLGGLVLAHVLAGVGSASDSVSAHRGLCTAPCLCPGIARARPAPSCGRVVGGRGETTCLLVGVERVFVASDRRGVCPYRQAQSHTELTGTRLSRPRPAAARRTSRSRSPPRPRRRSPLRCLRATAPRRRRSRCPPLARRRATRTWSRRCRARPCPRRTYGATARRWASG